MNNYGFLIQGLWDLPDVPATVQGTPNNHHYFVTPINDPNWFLKMPSQTNGRNKFSYISNLGGL